MPNRRPVVWVGTALDDLRRFPADARQRAGYGIYRLQCRERPPDWRPMASIGSGVIEIRIKTRRAFRVICAVTRREAIYVLHAFEKESRQTPLPDIALARRRMRLVLETDR